MPLSSKRSNRAVFPLPVIPLSIVLAVATISNIQAQSVPTSTIATHSYNQAAAPLAQALESFSRSSGIQIHFTLAQVQKLQAPALNGNYTVEQALTILLNGSGGLNTQRNTNGSYQLIGNRADSLNETIVRGAPIVDNVGQAVIRVDDMAKRNVGDMAGIVRYQPLVSAPNAASGQGNVWDGSGNNGFNVRGVEGNRVSLDLDGIPLPAAAPKPDNVAINSFGIGRDYTDPETFREVAIDATNSATSRNNSKLGANVSFVTKAPEDYVSAKKPYYFGYKLGYNAANSSTLQTLTTAGQYSDLQGLLAYTRRRGDETENFDNVPPPNHDRWTSDALLGKINWQSDSRNKLSFAVDHYQRDSKRDIESRIGTTYPEGAAQHSETERTTISLAHRYAPNQFVLFDTLNSKLYYQDAHIEDHTLAIYSQKGIDYKRDIRTGFYNEDTGLVFDAQKQVSAANKLSYGAGFNRNESRRPWSEQRTNATTGAVVSASTGSKNRMADSINDGFYIYAQDEFSFKLSNMNTYLTPTLRLERVSYKPKKLDEYVIGAPRAREELKNDSTNSILPSLDFRVELATGYDVYAQYRHGVRVPTPAEKTGTYNSFSYTGTSSGYATLGNPDLDKENSNSYEFGVKANAMRGVMLSTSVFYTQYKNFIEYAQQDRDLLHFPNISQLYRPKNIGRAKISGVELSSRLELGAWSPSLDGFSTTLATGAAHGTATNTTTSVRGKLPSVAPAKTSFILAYDEPSSIFGISAAIVHVASKQAEPDVIADPGQKALTRFKVPQYTTLDLFAYWNIGKRATINAGLYNATNRKYWDYASVRSEAATATANINRQSQPGRTASINFELKF